MNIFNDLNPLVTVYIPTYNRVDLLERAVTSVLKQTYINLEIIIVDDCSIDDTHDYLEELAKREKRVRYFIQEKNSGSCASRNIAIKNAKGFFITGLDDDDYFEESRIEDFISKWKKKSINTKVLYSLYGRENEKNPSKAKRIFKRMFFKKKVDSKDLLYFFYTGNQIFTETKLLQDNLFDVSLPAWQDFECFYRLLDNYDCNAELIYKKNYIVDTSHEYERISTKGIYNIKKAFALFKEKHKLNNTESKLLCCHLYNYPDIKISKIIILRRFFYKASILDIKRLVNIKVAK
jgi:glycosyltransferase involved in cell wall biosynthesis